MVSVVIYLYDGMTALDAVGPYDILNRVPGLSVEFVAKSPGPKRAQGGLHLVATHAIAEVSGADVLLVPGGGPRVIDQIEDSDVLEWIRTMHARTTWTVSVCTGSLILAAAGLLDGLEVATHWRARQYLEAFGATYSPDRFVQHDRILTSAGVTAGIDMAAALVAELEGVDLAEAVLLSAQYDPHPPVRTGTPEDARAEVLALVETLGPRD